MQATAIGTVAVTVALLGAFLFCRLALTGLGTQVLDQIEISAFLDANATPAQIADVRNTLLRDPRVASVQVVTKKAGLAQLRKRMGSVIDMSVLPYNFLPVKLRVRAASAEVVPALSAAIPKIKGVNYVYDDATTVQHLLQIGAVLRQIGIGLILTFVLVAGIIISNTIRLTVFARRREIAIMQLVGATNLYIRLPFICEGLLDGVLGAIVAVVVLAIIKATLWSSLLGQLTWVPLDAHLNAPLFALQLVLVGGLLGIVASWISVGRYLRT